MNDLIDWKSYLLPLPKEITINRQIKITPSDIAIYDESDHSEQSQQAVKELRQVFTEKANCSPDGKSFTIKLALSNEKDKIEGTNISVEDLRKLPNMEQAYKIFPLKDNCLIIAAIKSTGLYYGACTIKQLLLATICPSNVTIPIVNVRDWPDIPERGLWNFPDEAQWIPWLASKKLNYGKMAATHLALVERNKENSATIDRELMLESQKMGFNYSPFILHLNFLHSCGIYRAYPELAGKGDGALTGRYFAHKDGNQHRAPCATQPILVEILAEWMTSIANQGGLDISCWLSERPGQCECLDCTSIGQFVLEARAFVAAWKRVKKVFPKLQIRLFLSTTTLERDWRVLDETPSEIKIERACAMGLERIAHKPRDLFANPLYDNYASKGRWIASYDVPIGVNGDVDTPEFKLPEKSAHRVQNYVKQLYQRKYKGAYGMIAWHTFAKETDDFNISALAEWSWNTNGRSVREFAIAWGTSQGIENTELFADWSEIIGELAFDVFDSDFPIAYSQNKIINLIKERKRPYLGEGLFRYYESTKSFEKKRNNFKRAQILASKLPSSYLLETNIIGTYIDMAESIWHIADILATNNLEEQKDQEEMKSWIEKLKVNGEKNMHAIRTWRTSLGPEPWHNRVYDTLTATKKTVDEISSFIDERYIF
tara:strand:- start:1340 stop:3310 length:1971 start_codon:yes stop_codon:yes gene_type:complete